MENRELFSTELQKRLDKVFDEMLGSWSDVGDKTLTETGAENKTEMKNFISLYDRNIFNMISYLLILLFLSNIPSSYF